MEKLKQEVRQALQIKQALVRRPQVELETSLSRTTIYQKMKDGIFPLNVKVGKRSVAWRRADLDAWLADPSGYRAPAAEAA